MIEPTSRDQDRRVEQFVGQLLRLGVLTAAVVAAIGGVKYLSEHGKDRFGNDYRVFRGEPHDLRSVRGIVDAAKSLDAEAIIQLGLVLLIATPVVRVAFTLVAFALQRDRTYIAVTLLVLSVLIYGLFGT